MKFTHPTRLLSPWGNFLPDKNPLDYSDDCRLSVRQRRLILTGYGRLHDDRISQYGQVSIYISISAKFATTRICCWQTDSTQCSSCSRGLQNTAVGTDVALCHLPTGRDSSILTTNNYYHFFLNNVRSPVMTVCQHAVVFFGKKENVLAYAAHRLSMAPAGL